MTDRIHGKMKEVSNSVRKVEENMPESVQIFEEMSIEKDGIYKNVEHAIQATYDICALLVKENDLGIPSDERKLPDMLVKADIIDKELGERLKDMKGFRNRLAHQYGKIDDEIAYENIIQGLEDFQKFLDHVEEELR